MTSHKWLHVLGGGPVQVETVLLARQLGFKVFVTDMFEDAPAYAVADAHEAVNVVDMQGTLAAARRIGIHGIIADTSDVGVPTAAFVSSTLGLPGNSPEAALNTCDKSRLRLRCQNAGIVTPRFSCLLRGSSRKAVSEILESAGACIVKPADNQSGRGVSIVRRDTELGRSIDLAFAKSRKGVVLVETLLTGTEVIVDGFVGPHGPVVLAIASKRPDPANPTIASRIAYPAELPESAVPSIVETNRRTIGAVGLTTGLFHAEYIVTENAVVPIDVAARGGGVNIYRIVVPHVSGVELPVIAIRSALGEAPEPIHAVTCRAAVIEFLRAPTGVFRHVEGIDAARAMPGIALVTVNASPNSAIRPLEDKDARPGYLIALADSLPEAVARAQAARDCIRIEVDATEHMR